MAFPAGGQPVRYRLRIEARRRARAWASLALVIGLASGVALAAAAGARRTASAYPRFRAATEQEDAFIAPAAPDGAFNSPTNSVITAIDALPQVARSGRFAQLAVAAGRTLQEAESNFSVGSLALLHGEGYAMSRPKIVAGRMPDPDRADEAFVNPHFASAHGVGVGSRLPVVALDSDRADATIAQNLQYDGPVETATLTITGVGRFARDVVPTTVNDEEPLLYTTRAFYHDHPASLINYVMVVRLRPAVDVERFRRATIRAAGELGVPPEGVFFSSEADRTATVQRSVHPQVLALGAVALVLALAVFLVGGQALSRQVFLDSTDSPMLGAVGMTRRERFGLALARVAI